MMRMSDFRNAGVCYTVRFYIVCTGLHVLMIDVWEGIVINESLIESSCR